MAIKAGLVGVNPKGVDKNGMPIGSGGSVDAYTKAESDSKFATISNTYTKTETDTLLNAKVPKSQLTANEKTFHFAYDSTSEKYGYKLDGTGEFIPFEEAGGGPGWVKPAELITTGLTVNQFIEITSGGYYDDGTTVYVDIIVKQIDGGAGRVMGLPKAPASAGFVAFKDSTLAAISDLYVFDGTHTNVSVSAIVEGSSSYLNLGSNQGIGNYIHIFGAYIKAS